MKHIVVRTLILAFSLLIGTQAFAQYIPAWEKGDLEKKGGSIAVKDQKLNKEATLALLKEAGGAALADEWASAASKRGLGIGLTAGGFGVSLIGAGVGFSGAMVGGLFGGMIGSIKGDANKGAEEGTRNPMATAGWIAAGVGAVAGVIGVVQLVSANSKLNDIVDRCNAHGSHAASLTVGATPSGVGLALNF